MSKQQHPDGCIRCYVRNNSQVAAIPRHAALKILNAPLRVTVWQAVEERYVF